VTIHDFNGTKSFKIYNFAVPFTKLQEFPICYIMQLAETLFKLFKEEMPNVSVMKVDKTLRWQSLEDFATGGGQTPVKPPSVKQVHRTCLKLPNPEYGGFVSEGAFSYCS
jgi:hypothetical protein